MRPNMMVGALCLVSAAAFAACQPAQPVGAAAKDEPLKLEAQQPASKAGVKKAVAKPATKSPGISNAVAKDAVPASTAALELRTVAAKQQDQESVSATITGCLVLRDDGMFQLKDNDGEHAPKARSWKSGFIKKGSANIDVFDAGNRLNLGTHVNYRISVSGMLTDRQLRARSIHVTSQQCD
jgi:hypothetical protein